MALRYTEKKNGQLALSQFRRLKQLGTGDVGLVDMVELQDGSGRYRNDQPLIFSERGSLTITLACTPFFLASPRALHGHHL